VRAAGGPTPRAALAALLDLVDQRKDPFGRLGHRALPDQRNEKIDLAVGLVEWPPVLQQAVEQSGGAAAGRRHVDMRIGAVADHRAGVAYHLRRQIGVVVEAGHDRDPVTDQGADAAQQFALAVLVMLGDHRTMQVEIDAVERLSRGEIFEHRAGDLLVGVALDIGGRRRRAPARRHQLVPQFLQCLNRAGDRDVEALDRVDQLGPANKARPGVGPLEIGPGGALRRKGVGLMLKPADRNPRHIRALSPSADSDPVPCQRTGRKPSCGAGVSGFTIPTEEEGYRLKQTIETSYRERQQ
jgi:hypothetical protein